MRKIAHLFMLTAVCAMFFSCQKAVFDEDGDVQGNGAKLRFRVTQFEQIPFDITDATRGTNIGKACTRLNFAVYQNGERLKQINQQSSDAGFGTFNLSLKPGEYQLVVLAHSGEGNPTMTDPSKVTFPNNKVTDTFLYGDNLVVNDDSIYQIKLKRIVAMVRLQTTDTVTRNVKLVRFYYTGGSSTLNALDGVGCVNSKQAVNFDITSDMVGKQASFDVYTFPKADNKGLNLQVTTHDKSNNIVVEESISNVPVQRNVITLYKGRLFNRNADSKGDFNVDLNSDEEWAIDEHPF